MVMCDCLVGNGVWGRIWYMDWSEMLSRVVVRLIVCEMWVLFYRFCCLCEILYCCGVWAVLRSIY